MTPNRARRHPRHRGDGDGPRDHRDQQPHDRTYYYRVAGWQPAQFETCHAFGEEEVQEGPIGPGATVHAGIVAFADRTDVPIIVAIWDTHCGEGCQRAAPIAAILVARSPLQPAAS
jgi:hypothetical protein